MEIAAGPARTRVRMALATLAALALALVAGAPAAAGIAGWQGIAPLPAARWGVPAVPLPDGRILLLGGVQGEASTRVDAYDPATNTWSAAPSLPLPLATLAATAGPDGRVYALGGRIAATQFRRDVEVFDLATGRWSALPPMHLARMWFGAAAGRDGRIYAVGGRYDATVEAYDPQTRRWRFAPSIPVRPGLAVEANAVTAGRDGRIYVFGGLQGHRGAWALDPGTRQWTRLAPLPTSRLGAAVATAPDGRIYVLGGQGVRPTGEPGASLATVDVYDPATDTWSAGPRLPLPLDGLSAAVVGSSIYVFGGEDGGCCSSAAFRLDIG